MKGVILGINPDVRIVDVTHGISPQNVVEGSLSLSMSYGYFPSGSIHIAVIDPGVGSKRRPILAEADGHYFIGPDNGLFTSIFEKAVPGQMKVHHLTNGDFFLPARGTTFHGRDVFAPAAAWLSRGTESSEFGPLIDDIEKINIPKAVLNEDGTITGEIVSIDIFGNAISNIPADLIARMGIGNKIQIGFRELQPIVVTFYSGASDNSLHALINSFEMLELFVFKENAAELFDIRIGDSVNISTF
jgi:S-adenosylmethionine hydrolase